MVRGTLRVLGHRTSGEHIHLDEPDTMDS
jgi:hypothetical protein